MFPVLVSKQQMTGDYNYDQLWFLTNQFCSPGAETIEQALQTISQYAMQLLEQVRRLNFMNIVQFLQLSDQFSSFYKHKMPSITFYTEHFLRKYLISPHSQPPAQQVEYSSRPPSAGSCSLQLSLRPSTADSMRVSSGRLSGRSHMSARTSRPVSSSRLARPQTAEQRAVQKVANQQRQFFGWLSEHLDRWGCFQQQAYEVIEAYEQSEQFAEQVQQRFEQNAVLSFPDTVFITSDVQIGVSKMLLKHFGADATGLEKSVAMLAIDSFVLNLLQIC